MASHRGTPQAAYAQQKSNAVLRGIEFKLTFEDWLRIWVESGKLHLRGRGKDKYCMCRIGDAGAYEIGNVFVAMNSQNISEGNLGKRMSAETRLKIADAHRGTKHPWSAGANNPMHKPEVKAKITAAIGGEKHYKQRGVITPQGYFVTSKAASEALGIPKPTIEWRAKHNKFGFSQPAYA